MAILTKEAICKVNDLPTEVVSVPEWGGEVIVKTMSGIERDAYEMDVYSLAMEKKKDDRNIPENIRAKLCAATMVNEKGNLLFSDADDIKKLGQKSARALSRVFGIARKLNGIGDEDLEDLEKNYLTDQSEDSTSS